MRVLYVNHTPEISGGERSLLALLEALPAEIEVVVASPEGALAGEVRRLGLATAQIRGTAGSLRVHPRHTPQALAEMGLAARQVGRLSSQLGAEVVHANSIRAGIVVGLARTGSAAKVTHVRDCLPPGPLSMATMRLIAASAETVVANSRYTAESVRRVAPRARLEVVHNPVDLRRFDAAGIDRAEVRGRLGEAGQARVLLGVLAQLSPWKGQDTAVRALALLREGGVDAHLLLIGSAKFLARATRFDNEAYVSDLHELVAARGLQRHVSFLGEREDVPELLAALDALLLPSHEEPFGRALIEAMALGVPVLATDVGGPPEIVRDGVEGYLLDPHDPAAWAAAVLRVIDSADRGAAMGAAGRARAHQQFSSERHAAAMLDVYRRATA